MPREPDFGRPDDADDPLAALGTLFACLPATPQPAASTSALGTSRSSALRTRRCASASPGD